jgi:hypothetical protein
MSTSGNTGPPGRPRGIGFGIFMFIVTLHFYSWYWVFNTQEEIKGPQKEKLGSRAVSLLVRRSWGTKGGSKGLRSWFPSRSVDQEADPPAASVSHTRGMCRL